MFCPKRVSLLLVSLLLLSTSFSYSQNPTASLVGTVKDESGGVVPGVTVTATHLATNAVREAVTDSQGDYILANLPIGRFEVAAELPGFRGYLRSGVTLTVGQTARLDIDLVVGEISDIVTVETDVSLMQTETSSIGEVINNRTMTQLPLNGRNFKVLGSLLAGGTESSWLADRQEGATFASNGARQNDNNYMIDGVGNNAHIAGTFPVVTPSLDAIEEFKVERHNYSAEYGMAGGGVVNVVLKSGTNDWHGSLYQFHRNDALDARDFFAADVDNLKRNQFGGALGGPILKDKTFFFFNYEGLRERRSLSQFFTVPTEAMRRGDFSALPTLYDPLSLAENGTRLPFPNNQIPANRIHPVSKALIDAAVWPLPNRAGITNNHLASLGRPTDGDQVNIRGDHALTRQDQLTARYTYSKRTGPNIESIAHASREDGTDGKNAVLAWTRIFNPSVINDLRFGASRYSFSILPEGHPRPGAAAPLGLPDLASDPFFSHHPRVDASGIATVGVQTILARIESTFQVIDTLTWIKNKHSLKMGFEVRRYNANNTAPQFASGRYEFRSNFTGPTTRSQTGAISAKGYVNGFGDFLLGLPQFQQILNPDSFTPTYPDNHRFHLYLQDNWRVANDFTLNLGFRYEYDGQWTERNGRSSAFDFATGELVYPEAVRNDPVFEIARGGLQYPFRFDDDPAVGSNRLKDSTHGWGPRLGFAWQPFGRSSTVIRSGYGIVWTQPQVFFHLRQSLRPPFTGLQTQKESGPVTPELVFGQFGFGPTTPLVVRFPVLFPLDSNFTNGYVQQWNLTWQQQLIDDMALTVAYVGNKGTHLDVEWGNNPAPPGPGAIQPRRKYPQFGRMNGQSSRGDSHYHSLQATAERRFSRGLSFLSAYTWAYSARNGGCPDVNDWASCMERGGRPHRYVLSFIYDLPFRSESGFLNSLFGGWQTSGIVTFESGDLMTPLLSTDVANIGMLHRQRPNRIADGNLPSSQQTLGRWFDTGAFGQPDPFTFGNGGAGILVGPGTKAFDFSLMKQFQMPYSEGHQLQFRAEFFNFFNHPNFGNPALLLGRPDFGVIRSGGAGREIQLALRYTF